ncbi:hypothetical protein D9M68_925210 [compost metagenome]
MATTGKCGRSTLASLAGRRVSSGTLAVASGLVLQVWQVFLADTAGLFIVEKRQEHVSLATGNRRRLVQQATGKHHHATRRRRIQGWTEFRET